jgi:hypothetical protein
VKEIKRLHQSETSVKNKSVSKMTEKINSSGIVNGRREN